MSKILRVINKETGLFIRDDFSFDSETEIGLDVTPAKGFYLPKWNGESWIEGGEKPEEPESMPKLPTQKERLEALEAAMLELILRGDTDA